MSSNDKYNLQNNSDLETLENFKILISNIKSLKDKTWGCPWQKIQSHKSLIPFLNEESSEFIDAIYEKNAVNICEELGDLLLQVMLHAEIGNETKEFELNDIIKNLNKKIINRHPYIFNKKEKVSLEKSQQIWENIKNLEKEAPDIKSLKDKTWGCPWQKIQSHKSLIPFLYEESNEFIDAIYEKNANNICEEL